MILKSVRWALPDAFHGIFLWYAFAWVMQPIAAVWCLRAAGERRLLPAVCVAIIALCIPSWWNRFGHSALTGHFLLLLALGGYFHLLRLGSAPRWSLALLLNVSALLVHPYLFFMTTAIFVAVPVSALFRRDRNWGAQALYALSVLGLSFVAAAVLGYTGAEGGGSFGGYAMNLLSPFWPANSSLLPFEIARVETTPGSGWEGYNYLGAGMIGLLLIALLSCNWSRRGVVGRHLGLVLASVCLTVLSLSNNIGIGSYIISDVYLTNSILDNFRSSARFFWVVTYIILISLVLWAMSLRPAWVGVGVLILAATLQARDTIAMRKGLMWRLERPFEAWPLDAESLRRDYIGQLKLNVVPGFGCGITQEETELAIAALVVASEIALPVNTMFVARRRGAQQCDGDRLIQTPLEDGEVRIIMPSAREKHVAAASLASAYCHDNAGLLVCKRISQAIAQ